MMNLTLPRLKLHDQIVHKLGQRIVDGTFPQGESLPPEDLLGSNLGVSRSAVREAIKVLSAKGLVQVRPKTGTRILHRSHWHQLDPDVLQWQADSPVQEELAENLVEVRRMIEPSAAALAAVRGTEEDFQLLQKQYLAMEREVEDLEKFIAMDLEFHAAIFRAAHNRILECFAATITQALGMGRALTLEIPGAATRCLPYHKKVLDAICARQVDGAEKAMWSLMDLTRQDTTEALRARKDK
jgi:GntR family transcriptional regulator, galactonate operon transcriptional repressor